MTDEKEPNELDKFNKLMDGLLAVPYQELQEELKKDQKKKAAKKKRAAKRASRDEA